MIIDRQKYGQVILYLCKGLGGEIRGKKKLAKLLYFVDFDFFEKYGRPITNDIYKALPMGPFPSCLQEITKDMGEMGNLKITAQDGNDGYFPTEIFQCTTEPDFSQLSAEEKKMLDRVVLKYGRLNGKELEELSHAEAPYIGTKAGEEIAYELAFYRGTDFDEEM